MKTPPYTLQTIINHQKTTNPTTMKTTLKILLTPLTITHKILATTLLTTTYLAYTTLLTLINITQNTLINITNHKKLITHKALTHLSYLGYPRPKPTTILPRPTTPQKQHTLIQNLKTRILKGIKTLKNLTQPPILLFETTTPTPTLTAITKTLTQHGYKKSRYQLTQCPYIFVTTLAPGTPILYIAHDNTHITLTRTSPYNPNNPITTINIAHPQATHHLDQAIRKELRIT